MLCLGVAWVCGVWPVVCAVGVVWRGCSQRHNALRLAATLLVASVCHLRLSPVYDGFACLFRLRGFAYWRFVRRFRLRGYACRFRLRVLYDGFACRLRLQVSPATLLAGVPVNGLGLQVSFAGSV